MRSIISWQHHALFAFTAFSALWMPTRALSQDRLRVIIETDAGGDPDDEQSLVRFLLYANEWDVEGIIANRREARDGENLNRERTGFGIVKKFVAAYEAVYPALKQHSTNYPPPAQLAERTVCGYKNRDDAVNLIIAAADHPDPRPIWFLNWGTDHGSDPSNLRRALDKILAERGQEGYAKFKSRFLLSSDDLFGDHTSKIKPNWALWVEPKLPKVDGKAWYHRLGPLTATAGGFDLDRDVRRDHGALGAFYPTNTNIPQKEGDSLLFLYLIPTGMNDPMHPTWGSWAGRFSLREDRHDSAANYYWADAADTIEGREHRDNTLSRWATDIQNDFRARMDWCVKDFAQANHAPVAALDEDTSKKFQHVEARPGTTIQLDATRSTDPDKNSLSFQWIYYPEAGTYQKPLKLTNETEPKVTIDIPGDAKRKQIHIVLSIHDNGEPPLAAYRRAILDVN